MAQVAVPSQEVITELCLDSSLKAIAQWAGMSREVMVSFAKHFGFPEGEGFNNVHPRVFAAAPEDTVSTTIAAWDGATFFNKAMAHLIYKTAVTLCIPPKPAAMAMPSVGQGGGQAQTVDQGTPQKVGRKLKFSCVIDPIDETEFPAASKPQLIKWYDNFKAIKHGPPLEEKEPTADQIMAMHTRIVELGQEPYADFSILTPYGRRMAKRLRHRSWIPQEDGTYKPMEVPGPDSFMTWETCYNVYEVILFMLRFPPCEAKSGEPTPKPIEVATPIASET